jgi:glycosyltransferase 2 family protein
MSIPLEPEPSRTSHTKIVVSILAVGLAGLLLYFSLRGIEWRQVGILLSGAKPAFIAATCVLSTISLFLRATRWRILLCAGHPVSVSDAFWATSVGYFGNNFLPARAGEIARTLMISSRTGLSRTFVLTTALMERMADAVALVVITALVLLTLPSQPAWLADATKPFAILGFCGVLAIVILPYLERFFGAILARVPVSPAIRAKLITLLEHILNGIRAFHDTRRALGFLMLTIVIWSVDATGTVVGAKALGLLIPWPVAFLLIAGLGLGNALPSTPGYLGIYQFVAVSVLTPFGFSKTNAIAYILMFQAISYVFVGFWGSLGFWKYRHMKLERPSPVDAQTSPLTTGP